MSHTQKHIARYLVQPAILRNPNIRKVLQEVCQEVKNTSQTFQELGD